MEEITALLEAIVEQTETIGRHGGKIPQIELDLVKENLRKLYEAYHRLDRDNAVPESAAAPAAARATMPPPAVAPSRPPVPVPIPETGTPHPSTPEPVAVNAPLARVPSEAAKEAPPATEEKSETDRLFEDLARSAAVPEPVAATASTPAPPSRPAVPSPEPPAEAPRITIPRRPADIPLAPSPRNDGLPFAETDTPRLADKLRKEERTLNDQVEGRNGFSLAERLQQNRISDLKAALGINDKFLFINDLFAGDSERYNQAIEALNSMPGMDEANIHLNHLQQQNGWEKDSPALSKLRDFLRRRYL